ncbi:MAG: lipopolysaccharide biosynthesis protein [Notoacmeibacter sp.]|nr:lipopolysaccharide biosynthesis protein [Notoacmeibacter sp.]
MLRGYASAISGSLGRLVFSLAYFVLLANTLSIAEFGVFATASAAGVVLSRIVAFGFSSPLYRAATMRPRLVGLYTGGYLVMAAASLPVLALAAWIVHAAFFARDVGIHVFALFVIAEALLWRTTEIIVIVNNGMNRFGRAAVLVILGTVFRTMAAGAFWLAGAHDLATWAYWYLAANALALLTGVVFFQPRQRLRFKTQILRRRMADSLTVSGAEILFYIQTELDKLLVLALGGAQMAGIYAIIMRLVDLTAIPVRTFNMMLVQSLMRNDHAMASKKKRVLFEAGIFFVSTAGLLTLAFMLYLEPRLLGDNVAEATPLVLIALLVPGLRNLTEYHAELLYARGQTFLRAVNLALLGGVKAVLLSKVLLASQPAGLVIRDLNWIFLALYAVSAILTYTALRRPSKAF